MERLFDLDVQLLADSALTIVNIFILFILASYLFFYPVRSFLKARQDRIQNDLNHAETEKKTAMEQDPHFLYYEALPSASGAVSCPCPA